MNEAQVKERRRYERTLNRNRVWLHHLLNLPSRREEEYHLLVAARLRVLLCNRSDGPALLDYADLLNLADQLTIWGPTGSDHPERAFPPRHGRWTSDGYAARDVEPVSYPIDGYLNKPVGWWYPERDWKQVDQYTPRNLINWAANSEAVHHIPASADKVQRLRGVRRAIVPFNVDPKEARGRGEDYIAKDLFALGEWTVAALDQLLADPEEPPE